MASQIIGQSKLTPIPSEPGAMIIGKPGEAPPDGYTSGRWLPTAARSYHSFAQALAKAVPSGSVEDDSGAALMTPVSCRASRNNVKATRLLGCWVSKHGPGVHVELSDGVCWPMYLRNLEHISDPLFDDLTTTERDQIIDHFMQTPPAELLERFLQQEKPTLTLLRRSGGVRLWGSQTVAHELHGERCSARVHYHVTVDSDVSVALMGDFDRALENFVREVGGEL